MVKNVLIINGHQVQPTSPGKLNATLVEHAKNTLTTEGLNVKTSHINDSWDNEEEVQKFEWADVIILQIPSFWFNIPWATKKYIDEVFMHGYGRMFAHDGRSSTDPSKEYGSGGLLNSTKYMISMTWNAPKDAFIDSDKFFEGHPADNVLMGTHKAFQFCGMSKLPTFICHDVMKNPTIENDLLNWKKHLLENITS